MSVVITEDISVADIDEAIRYTHAMLKTDEFGNRKKTDRIIWSLQGRFEHGRIVLNSEEDWDDFTDQLLMFPANGVHDDLPDALSYIDQLAVFRLLC